MGSTPSSYPLSSDDLVSLSGIAYPIDSDDLVARSDVPGYPLSSDDLLGLTDVNVSAPNGNVSSAATTASASFSLLSDGNTTASRSGSGTNTVNGDDWYTPITSGVGSGYSVRVTKTAGATNPSGTLGSWLVLSSTRTWTLTSTFGVKSCTLLVEIRQGTGAVIASGTVTLTAEGGSA